MDGRKQNAEKEFTATACTMNSSRTK